MKITNLVIAGSHGQYVYYLRREIELGNIEEHDRKTYRYLKDPHQLKGVHPENTHIHYWGDHLKNKVMRSGELLAFTLRQRDMEETCNV